MKAIAPFIIDNNIVHPGESKTIQISIARLPSGNHIYFKIFVHRSKVDGPCVLIMGGLHGDEINGVEIVRRTLAAGLYNNIRCGSVIVIPLVNIYGFINFSRAVPDGKDVNRSFPGSPMGSLAARVANMMTQEILPHVDFGIDFHTGGSARYNYPQIRFTENDKRAEELAKIFAAPFTIGTTPIDKSLRSEAVKKNVSFLVFEGGESLRLDAFSIAISLNGIKRVLNHFNMINKVAEPIDYSPISLERTTWVRSTKAGLFWWFKQSGEEVEEGEVIGEINSYDGETSIPIYCPKKGFIIGHNNACVVNQGDALFHIGYNGDDNNTNGNENAV